MKVAEYVSQRLEHLGLDTCFAVTGGGAMHLNDAFGEAKTIDCRYMHHEQSASIAAEGYARIAGKPAILNVPELMMRLPLPAPLEIWSALPSVKVALALLIVVLPA